MLFSSVLSRVFESLVYDSFISRKYNYQLGINHFGFRENSTTECALNQMLNTSRETTTG